MKEERGNKLDDGLSDALSEAVFSGKESSFSDRDAFRNWLIEGEQRQLLVRRRKIRRAVLTAAAVFLCVFFLTGSFMVLTDSLPASLQALLGPEEGVAVPGNDMEIEPGNGNIVIGGDGNGNAGTWTATFTSYDDIPEKYQEQIVWFEDMPEGYELESITIVQTDLDISIYSGYSFGDSKLFINQNINPERVNRITELLQFDELVVIDDHNIYYKFSDGAETYAFENEEDIIILTISEKWDKKKIEAMVASIRTGWNR